MNVQPNDQCNLYSASQPEHWRQALSMAELQSCLDGESGEVRTRPLPDDWGYYLHLGPELGYFSWFRSRNQMLRYLVHVEILHAPTSLPERAEYDTIVARLIPIAADYEQTEDSLSACQAFNACFPDFRLEWIGSFEQLLAGESEFARQLLTAYGADPILNLPAFAAFAEDYGL